MGSLLGIKGIQIKEFYGMSYDIDEINRFLKMHDGNVINVMYGDKANILVVYKESEEEK